VGGKRAPRREEKKLENSGNACEIFGGGGKKNVEGKPHRKSLAERSRDWDASNSGKGGEIKKKAFRKTGTRLWGQSRRTAGVEKKEGGSDHDVPRFGIEFSRILKGKKKTKKKKVSLGGRKVSRVQPSCWR